MVYEDSGETGSRYERQSILSLRMRARRDHGLYQLLGTIRYPGGAACRL
jgi:hypothetical protein